MKKKTIMLLIIFVVTIITLIIFKTIKNSIIKDFNKHRNLFEEAIEELKKENNDIRFEKVGNVILISIYENKEENVNVIKIKESEFYKYNKTIDLIKRLDLEQVIKIDENIDFLFKSSLSEGKSIVYLKNIEDYISSGNKIRKEKCITENWYYITTIGL